MKRTVLIFGTIAGVIVSAFMATSMAIMGCSSSTMNESTSMIIGFASMIIAFSFVFVGVKNFRDKQNDGVISFGKAFLIGFLISLIASTLYVITWGIEFHFFMPDFMDKYATMHIEQLKNTGMKGQELETAIEEMNSMSHSYKNNLLVFAMYTYMEILPVGIIITLISALILKRKKSEV